MELLDGILRLNRDRERATQQQAIVDAYTSGCADFFEILRLALDPFVIFGVKRVAEILDDDGSAGDFSVKQFFDLCGALATRALRGERARDAIMQAASRCHAPTWNMVYRRVLLKDIGIKADLLNDVIDKFMPDAMAYRVPLFRPQMPAHTGKATGRRLVDAKVSGERVLAVLDGFARLHRSDGAVLDDHAAIEAALGPLCQHMPVPFVLDGVLTTGTFHIFDAIPLAEFRVGQCLLPQQTRRAVLEGLQRNGAFPTPRLIKVEPQIEVDLSRPEGVIALDEFCQQARTHGHSGVVIKKPDAPYIGKRSAAWIIRKF